MRAVNLPHNPETRKELADDLAWLWEEEDRLLGVLYASLPREGHRALRETLQEALRRLERAHARAREVLERAVREEG